MFGKKKHSPPSIPRFCPRCKLDEFDDDNGSSCPECGDTLRPKGFCPVCERHLLQPPGASCRKHDVVLESAPPVNNPTPVHAGEYINWVTISILPSSAVAGLWRSRLEAEGIPTNLDGERMGGAGMYLVATKGVRLQVPADRVGDARIILSQNWSLPVDEESDFEDLL